MNSQSQKAKDIFVELIGNVSPDEWEDRLVEASGGDEELLRRVRALLRAHAEPGSFLEEPAVANQPDQTLDQPITEKPGTQIGPYKLLQQIGEGGMGVVYMAEQKEPVKRRVALKIIKPGMDTRQVIARFEAERQALAMMDHPNIAKVLDAGQTESGRPYFVMELVNGLPVTKYCDEQHLTPKERLELFVPICQAVQHAHQKGIIHRDLKPSNILVALYDGRAVPKIIDFGVAKATSQTLTEKTMFTQLGQVVGTLEYMSPEQAERNQLDIDTRSDIYSLGVVLYELLTGETPFDRARLRSAAFDEMLRIIREEEPSKPSTKVSSSESLPSIAANRRIEPAKLGSMIRGELDWIVLKAMEKDRGRRYETASKFAEDVQHYLNDEAVVACPPSRAYKFRKFARRNKAVMGTTVAVAASLIIGSGLALWQAIEARKERDRAVIAEAVAEEHLQVVDSQKEEIEEQRQKAIAEAQKANREAQKAVSERAISDGVLEFLLKDLLGMADAGTQVENRIPPDPNIKLHTLLDRAAGAIDERFIDQPYIEATIRRTLGGVYLGIGRYRQAEEQARRALDLVKVKGPEDPDTLMFMNQLATSLDELGQYEEAEKLHRETLDARRRILGDEHPATLQSMNNLANTLFSQGRIKEAEGFNREAFEVSQRVLGTEHPSTLLYMNNLAVSLFRQQKYPEAKRLRLQALEVRKRVSGPEHPETLRSMSHYAESLRAEGSLEEAERLYRNTLELSRRVLGTDHPIVIAPLLGLAKVAADDDRHADAETRFREALELANRSLGPDHPRTLGTMGELAASIHRQHRYEDCDKLYREILKISKGVPGLEHSITLVTMDNLAESKMAQGQYQDAETIYRELLELRHRLLGAEHRDTLKSQHSLGVALYQAKDPQSAVEAFETAKSLGDSGDGVHRMVWAMACWKTGKHQEAVDHFIEAARWGLQNPRVKEQYAFWDEAIELFADSEPNGITLATKALSQRIGDRHFPLRRIRAKLYAEQKAWDEAAADYAILLDKLPEFHGWGSLRIQSCRELAAWPDVFARLVASRPNDAALWIGRAHNRLLESKWSEALEDYTHLTSFSLNNDSPFEYAALLVLQDNLDGYKAVCQTLSVVDAATEDANTPYDKARIGGISPNSGVKPAQLVEWAKQGVEESRSAWHLHALGLALYRAGQLDEAIDILHESNNGNWLHTAKAQNHLVLAMAHHSAGRQREAREWLKRAQRMIQVADRAPHKQALQLAPPDWVGLAVLRLEAEKLIEGDGHQDLGETVGKEALK